MTEGGAFLAILLTIFLFGILIGVSLEHRYNDVIHQKYTICRTYDYGLGPIKVCETDQLIK